MRYLDVRVRTLEPGPLVPKILFTKSDCAIDNCDYDLLRDEHIKN